MNVSYLTLDQIIKAGRVLTNSNLSELDIPKDQIFVQSLTLGPVYYSPYFDLKSQSCIILSNSSIRLEKPVQKWTENKLDAGSRDQFFEIAPLSRIVVHSNEVIYGKIDIKVHINPKLGIFVHCEHATNGRVHFTIFNHTPVRVYLSALYPVASCRFYGSSNELTKLSTDQFNKLVDSSRFPYTVLPEHDWPRMIPYKSSNNI